MQIPEQDICPWLQGAFFVMKFKCEPFDVPDIHTLHTRAASTLDWGTGQVVQVTSEILPSSPICRRWVTAHSLLLLVTSAVLVEDVHFCSSTCLSSAREIIMRSVSSAFLPLCASSFCGEHSSESLAKEVFNTQSVVSGNELLS